MIAIILSVGPPYRQPMIQNGTISSITNLIVVPFIVTIIITVLFTTITVLFPPSWLASVLELTHMSISFGFLLIAIALGNFIICWISENIVFVKLREMVDRFSMWRRKRKYWGGNVNLKRYQVVEEAI